MNYSTLEEAWGPSDSKKAMKKFSISSMKHPLLRKAGDEDADPPEPVAEAVPSVDAVRDFLRGVFQKTGIHGINALLPRGCAHLTEDRSMFDWAMIQLDIEEIARWMLVAAIIYIIMDVTGRR